jgi:hypothetical protein
MKIRGSFISSKVKIEIRKPQIQKCSTSVLLHYYIIDHQKEFSTPNN